MVEVGGGLRSYSLGAWAVLDGYREDEMCGAGRGQLLVPWPNRIDGGAYSFEGKDLQLPLTEPLKRNAIHGLARWSAWTVLEAEASRAVLAHTIHAQPGYPFTLDLTASYRLGEAGLAVRLTAVNAGAFPCPFGSGAHPYVTVGEELVDTASLLVPAAVRLLNDDRGIPTGTAAVEGGEYDFRSMRPLGRLVLDTAFTGLDRDGDGRARVVMTAGDGSRSVTVWADAQHPYLMLFTGDTLDPDRRRHGLAVEPMTCAPNAFRSGDGLRVLQPGEEWTGEWGISPVQHA